MKHQRFMRFIFLALLALLGAAPTMVGTPSDGGVTKVERTYLLSLLKSSETSFVSSIAGLTQEQWTFKPSPDAWSIQECAEHLILAEDLIFEESQKDGLRSQPRHRPAEETLPSAGQCNAGRGYSLNATPLNDATPAALDVATRVKSP